MKNKVLIEVCCGSIDDALQAQLGGADRVELNSALFLGGLTPSIGTIIEVKKRLEIPVMVMIRPRAGGFRYNDTEIDVMEQDIKRAVNYGADGIVFGLLTEDGRIDQKRCERLIKAAGDVDVVFHRAFDVTPDPWEAIDQLINLGFTRILTSGQRSSTAAGVNLLKELNDYAAKKIEILPGGGIKDYNIKDIVQKVGCNQIHITSFKTMIDNSTVHNPEIFFGSGLYPPENIYQLIDSEGIKSLKNMVN